MCARIALTVRNGRLGRIGSVITLDETTPIPASLRGALLTVGNFDGVHRGHGELIARLRTHADRMGVSAVVLTFDPHPVALPL